MAEKDLIFYGTTGAGGSDGDSTPLTSDWLGRHRASQTLHELQSTLTDTQTDRNRHIIEAFEEQGQNYIAGVWHNNIPSLTYPFGRMGLVGLISNSRDGKNIAWASKVFGLHSVRGSSGKKTVGGLRGLLRVLAAGGNVATTPDGPQGPRYVLQPGIVAVAQMARVPIVPMACSGAHILESSSWDRMKLPRPFSRVAIYVGNPIWIDRKEKEPEAARLKVEQAMRRTEAVVEQFVEGKRLGREPLLAGALEGGAGEK